MYHNPADFGKLHPSFYVTDILHFILIFLAIELASGEYGMDKVKQMSNSINNGECLTWFENPQKVMNLEQLRRKFPITDERSKKSTDISEFHQLKVLLRRGVIKSKRDQTLTHLRIGVNIVIAALLGWLFIGSGNEGSRVLDNYNLLFGILMHHMMTTMMLTILTCE